jgi:hypothetical protein
MRSRVDELLADAPREWEVVNVDEDDELARRWSDEIPILFVNGRLFARGSLPSLSLRERLLRAASEPEPAEESS